jgi:hypothetical protein
MSSTKKSVLVNVHGGTINLGFEVGASDDQALLTLWDEPAEGLFQLQLTLEQSAFVRERLAEWDAMRQNEYEQSRCFHLKVSRINEPPHNHQCDSCGAKFSFVEPGDPGTQKGPSGVPR